MEKVIKSVKDMGIELAKIIDSYLSKAETKRKINDLLKDYPELVYNEEGTLRTTIIHRLGARRMHILKDILLIKTEAKNIIKRKVDTKDVKTDVSWLAILESMGFDKGNQIPPRRSLSKCLDGNEAIMARLKSTVKDTESSFSYSIEVVITNKRILWKVNPVRIFNDPYNKNMITLCNQLKAVYAEKGMGIF